jgi:CRP-like cAMP-binding protein
MRVAEGLMLAAAVIALWSVLRPGPISLTLFMVMAQSFIVIGVVLYVSATLIRFKRRHGVSRVHFAAGETIFQQGDAGDFLYIITRGEVAVIREEPDQGPKMIAKLGPGEYVGEMALVNNAPRSATVRTLTSVDAVSIERLDFTALYTYLPDLQRNVDEVILKRQIPS